MRCPEVPPSRGAPRAWRMAYGVACVIVALGIAGTVAAGGKDAGTDPEGGAASYCASESSGDDLQAVCGCDRNQCVRKCCREHEVFSNPAPYEYYCKANGSFTLEVGAYADAMPVARPKRTRYVVTKGCAQYALEDDADGRSFLQEDGTLQLQFNTSTDVVDMSNFCFETVLTEYTPNENETALDDVRTVTFVCFPKQQFLAHLAVGMLISVPFLLATFLVYAFIPELRNLHGRSLMCHVLGLAVAYMCLSVLQIDTNIRDTLCITLAVLTQFAFLVSFFWLNVMCFDIWWTFSGFRGFHGSIRDTEHKKFLVYSAYAWGLPIIISGVTITMQFHPAVPLQSWLHPKFGNGQCWFQEQSSTTLYLYGPLVIIICCNILLFASTALKILKIKRDTAVLKKEESHKHDTYQKNKQRFNLYLKLFIVMGINWAMELISFFVGDRVSANIWLLTDITNTLYGLLIFVIFVCKRQIWKLLVKRYHIMMGKPHLANATFTRTQVTAYSVSQSTGGPSITEGSVKIKKLDDTPY